MTASMDKIPIARATDPASSHAAAREVTASGAREHQILIVREAVYSHPGKTSLELVAFCDGLDRYVIARRLPELEKMGAVKKGPQRMCSAGGRLAVTWLPQV